MSATTNRHNMVRPSPVERLVTNTALSKSSETGDLHQNDQERLRLWRHPSSLSLSPKPSFEMLVNLLSFEMLMRLIRKSMSMFQTFAVTLPPGSSPALVKNDWDGPLWH